MSQLRTLTTHPVLALTMALTTLMSASCGHKADPKYCSQQFAQDTQKLAEAGQKAEDHWNDIKGDTKKMNLKKLKPFKDQCSRYFKKYDADMSCVNPLDSSIVSPRELKQGCEFVEKAFDQGS